MNGSFVTIALQAGMEADREAWVQAGYGRLCGRSHPSIACAMPALPLSRSAPH